MFAIGTQEIMILTPLIISIILFIIGFKTKNQAAKYIIGAILIFLGLYVFGTTKGEISTNNIIAWCVFHLTIMTPSILGIILLIHTYFKFKKN